MIEAVVFDIGGVFVDWNPRHLYRQVFAGDEAAMEVFLSEVCTPAWNDRLDRGLPFAEGVAELCASHPDQAERIEVYLHRWPEMLGGVLDESLALLGQVRAAGVACYALSNHSTETFPVADERYGVRSWFDGVLLSGEVGVAKPDAAIFEELCRRFDLTPATTVFVDDSPLNVAAAAALGFHAHRFTSAPVLARWLRSLDGSFRGMA